LAFLFTLLRKAFLLPHQITGGGVTGIGALFYYAANIPISVTYFSINAVLLLISIKSIGLNFSLRTIFGVAVMTMFFSIIPVPERGTFVGPNEDFMACVIGGLLAGAGIIEKNIVITATPNIVRRLKFKPMLLIEISNRPH
jgi:uncharacterized membrane-anchored protein YitT (DUF2179 family)